MLLLSIFKWRSMHFTALMLCWQYTIVVMTTKLFIEGRVTSAPSTPLLRQQMMNSQPLNSNVNITQSSTVNFMDQCLDYFSQTRFTSWPSICDVDGLYNQTTCRKLQQLIDIVSDTAKCPCYPRRFGHCLQQKISYTKIYVIILSNATSPEQRKKSIDTLGISKQIDLDKEYLRAKLLSLSSQIKPFDCNSFIIFAVVVHSGLVARYTSPILRQHFPKFSELMYMQFSDGDMLEETTPSNGGVDKLKSSQRLRIKPPTSRSSSDDDVILLVKSDGVVESATSASRIDASVDQLLTSLKYLQKQFQNKVKADAWHVGNFPSPITEPHLCGSLWVCDPDDVLTERERLLLHTRLNDIPQDYPCICISPRNCTGHEGWSGPKVNVVLVKSLRYLDTSKNGLRNGQIATVESMADSLRKTWSLGFQCYDSGVIFYALDINYLYVSLGKGIENRFTHNFTRNMVLNVPPFVRARQSFSAVNASLDVLQLSLDKFVSDRAYYLQFITVLLIALVLLTPFICLLGLAFTK